MHEGPRGTATSGGPHLPGTLADEGPALALALTSVPSGLREAAGGYHSSARPGHVSRTRGAGQTVAGAAGLQDTWPSRSHTRLWPSYQVDGVALRPHDSATKPQHSHWVRPPQPGSVMRLPAPWGWRSPERPD